jgi:hypothetical protein
VTPRRLRGLAVVGGALALLGPRIAPRLDPGALAWLSPLWLAVVLGLAALGWRVARAWFGRLGAALGALAALALLAALTGVDWSGRVGTYLPCRRNWGRQPSYLLRASPTESLTLGLDGTRVKLCYGSPRARGRRMIGGSLVPYGRLWRTGANEPTTLRLSGPLTVGDLSIEGGKVAVYSVPGPETWEIVLNRSTSQWGLEDQYTPAIQAQELGRTVVPARRAERYVERLTFRVDQSRPDSADLVLAWEWVEVRIPLRAGQAQSGTESARKIQEPVGAGRPPS